MQANLAYTYIHRNGASQNLGESKMFAVYEKTTGQIVASFYDRRIAESHAETLSDDYGQDGYEYAVMEIKI